MFPPDDYTPHGYLATPRHAFRLRPLGVLRSVAPVGFAWHFPSYAGPYNRHDHYTSALRVGLILPDRRLLTADDFARAGIQLVSRYHSSRLMTFDWSVDRLQCSAAFLSIGDDRLGCVLTIENRGEPLVLGCLAVNELDVRVGAAGLWEEGVYARADAVNQVLLAGEFPEGPAFPLRGEDGFTALAVGSSPEELSAWHAGGPGSSLVNLSPETRQAGEPAAAHVWTAGRIDLDLGQGETRTVQFWLDRTRNPGRPVAGDYGTHVGGRTELPRRRQADARFWGDSPQMSGDWPDHWRHGLVYDFETLRLVLRAPAGGFHATWDGMQVQAPRMVLAETALDMLLLSYADPETARRAILGAFEDALGRNLPCSREDGSVNMVAADGAACGTAPEWCYPFHCVDLIYRRCGGRDWIAALYPRLVAYLEWWLFNRRDADGWLHYHCSWESGQDGSPRFGEQPTGGTLIPQFRPPDLQAAVAQSARVLAGFAGELGHEADVAHWRAVEQEFTDRTRALWRDGWFRDYDAGAGRWVEFEDVMHLAPVFCGVAAPEQVAALRPRLANPPGHGVFPPLVWPPPAWTLIESAWLAGERALAARYAVQTIDRVWRAADARDVNPRAPLPGVSAEWWPETTGRGGCEGYGWGALGIALLIRNVVGFRETDRPDTFTLTPSLPPMLAVPGRHHRIGPLTYRDFRFALEYAVRDDGDLDVTIERWGGRGEVQSIHTERDEEIEVARASHDSRFRIRGFESCLVRVG